MAAHGSQLRFQPGQTVLNIGELNEVDLKSDLRHRNQVLHKEYLDGTIHPFTNNKKSFISSVSKELGSIITEPQAKSTVILIVVNLVCTVLLFMWCHTTNSMALTAFTYLTIFDILCLLTCLLTLWVQTQKPVPVFSFGYERFEVLAVFSCTMLAQLGALFVTKESVERLLEPEEIHLGRLLMGAMLALCIHIITVYSLNNKAITHVVDASSSSWLQEHVADMSESVCHFIPGLSKVLLPRINPFILVGYSGALAVLGVYFAVDLRSYHSADTVAAVCIAAMTWGTMFPMSIYSGKILLQTTPSHVIGQLDKCLREASTLDGVLEFRHEHFWTLSFNVLAGSMHVRIRRDANEQLVLAHVSNRLANLVNNLTIQIFKDDWSRASAYQIITNPSLTPPRLSSPNSTVPPSLFKADFSKISSGSFSQHASEQSFNLSNLTNSFAQANGGFNTTANNSLNTTSRSGYTQNVDYLLARTLAGHSSLSHGHSHDHSDGHSHGDHGHSH